MSGPAEPLVLGGLAAAVIGLSVGLLWLARKARDHRRHLDARVDALAAESHDRALAADRRADEITARLERLERAQRVDHLLDLIALGTRDGRIEADAARRLEVAALALRVDAAGLDADGLDADGLEAAGVDAAGVEAMDEGDP